jgi:hypothetical protein
MCIRDRDRDAELNGYAAPTRAVAAAVFLIKPLRSIFIFDQYFGSTCLTGQITGYPDSLLQYASKIPERQARCDMSTS